MIHPGHIKAHTGSRFNFFAFNLTAGQAAVDETQTGNYCPIVIYLITIGKSAGKFITAEAPQPIIRRVFKSDKRLLPYITVSDVYYNYANNLHLLIDILIIAYMIN